MRIDETALDRQMRKAVKQFWLTRTKQSSSQGTASGRKDQGGRQAVTGGKQMSGFEELVSSLLTESGVKDECIFCNTRLELPGYFRPEKKWDLLVVADGQLLASVEFKSQVGPSFGNNYNNRSEEAIGNATDLWTAYREGAFRLSSRPWLGYLFLLEDCPESLAPVNVREPHYPVFEDFKGASYTKRYEILLTKFLRERLYDSVCLISSKQPAGRQSGSYTVPCSELAFPRFVRSLMSHVTAHYNRT